ncbi:hypothetical protein ACHAW5_001294 [Stephanodiscus triporus]|uniref:Uncharacterized protein n=1 Tax=Stephanodiscus triporus TaxID=2934178 RepID=A0ABD3NG91_9STRA
MNAAVNSSCARLARSLAPFRPTPRRRTATTTRVSLSTIIPPIVDRDRHHPRRPPNHPPSSFPSSRSSSAPSSTTGRTTGGRRRHRGRVANLPANDGGSNGENRDGDDGDDDDDDDEWMPPDDSPLIVATDVRKSSSSSSSSSGGGGGGQRRRPSSSPSLESSPSRVRRDVLHDDDDHVVRGDEVIEVVDIEATLADERNRPHLPTMDDEADDAKDYRGGAASASGFGMESIDVGWSEVLRELRNDGRDDEVRRLVEKYDLRGYLDALDDDDDDDKSNVDLIDVVGFDAGGLRHDLEEDDDKEDDWDEEFEESLRGLSEEELIDELIEDSPSLTQLEMEILSQEMERSEREEGEGEGDGGLDYDSPGMISI